MGILECSWCDFYVWTLEGRSTEIIHFDKSFWENMLIKLDGFYIQSIVPEIFTRRVKRGKQLMP